MKSRPKRGPKSSVNDSSSANRRRVALPHAIVSSNRNVLPRDAVDVFRTATPPGYKTPDNKVSVVPEVLNNRPLEEKNARPCVRGMDAAIKQTRRVNGLGCVVRV